jgi:hypothetical protein
MRHLKAWMGNEEKLIWLDKACIDQSDISANLSALPVFLSGCRELLVLAGASYPTRLWCTIEIFTYLRVGGGRDSIRMYELSTDVRSALARFRTSRARCSVAKDRQHLLAVIEAGFGDFEPFDRLVRSLFAGAKVTDSVSV